MEVREVKGEQVVRTGLGKGCGRSTYCQTASIGQVTYEWK